MRFHPKGSEGSALERSRKRLFCFPLTALHASAVGRTLGRLEENRITRHAYGHGCNSPCELVDWLNIEVRGLGRETPQAYDVALCAVMPNLSRSSFGVGGGFRVMPCI
jgi:hypothetical protein